MMGCRRSRRQFVGNLVALIVGAAMTVGGRALNAEQPATPRKIGFLMEQRPWLRIQHGISSVS
jgi:hypothetical protein